MTQSLPHHGPPYDLFPRRRPAKRLALLFHHGVVEHPYAVPQIDEVRRCEAE
jgi:hypothetical protein